MLKDVERREGWLGHRRGSSSGRSAPGSCIQLCMPTDLERDGEEKPVITAGINPHRSQSSVTSHRMIHCTDGRSGEVMLYSTTKRSAWLGNVLLGTLLAILTLREPFSGGKSNPTALPAYANLCWALSTEKNQHLTACYKEMGSLRHAVTGFPLQLLCLITVPHGWVPSSTSPPTHLSV